MPFTQHNAQPIELQANSNTADIVMSFKNTCFKQCTLLHFEKGYMRMVIGKFII